MNDDEEEAIKSRLLKDMLKKEGFPDEPIELNDADFMTFVQRYPRVVVDCWAEWCAPCRAISPIIEMLAKKYQGRVVFGKLNIDKNPLTTSRYQVMSIPTLLVFLNGELIDRVVGALPKPLLESRLAKVLGI
jgi:thioredoxin 1